jgi:hypothetical protein
LDPPYILVEQEAAHGPQALLWLRKAK